MVKTFNAYRSEDVMIIVMLVVCIVAFGFVILADSMGRMPLAYEQSANQYTAD